MTQTNNQTKQSDTVFPLVFFIGITVLLMFVFTPRGVRVDASAVQATAEATAVPVVVAEPTAQPTPEDHMLLMMSGLETVNASSVERGQRLYASSCSACHGLNATGVAGLGKSLVDSDFVNQLNDDQMVAFLLVGRSATDPLNTTGVMMPAKGGNTALTDEDLHAITDYMRSLNGATVVADEGTSAEPVVYETRPFEPAPIHLLDPASVPPSAGASGVIDLDNMTIAEIYSWSCSACHGVSGEGIEGFAKPLALSELDPEAIAQSLAKSAVYTSDPAFQHPTSELTVDQIRSIIEYLQSGQ